jgi:hypothetical protein
MEYVITLHRQANDDWQATVEPPLNDGGPYINWPSAAACLSAIADDLTERGED